MRNREQAATRGEVVLVVDSGQFIPSRQRNNQLAMRRCQRARRYNQAAIRLARKVGKGALNFAGLRTFTGLSSTPNDGAATWIAPHWPVPAGLVARIPAVSSTDRANGALYRFCRAQLQRFAFAVGYEPVPSVRGRMVGGSSEDAGVGLEPLAE